MGRTIGVVGMMACGPPLLHGLPRPDPDVVAGLAAATAAAATLADPQAAARLQERGVAPSLEGTSGPREVVPLEVLDRRDREEAAHSAASQPAPSSRVAVPAP